LGPRVSGARLTSRRLRRARALSGRSILDATNASKLHIARAHTHKHTTRTNKLSFTRLQFSRLWSVWLGCQTWTPIWERTQAEVVLFSGPCDVRRGIGREGQSKGCKVETGKDHPPFSTACKQQIINILLTANQPTHHVFDFDSTRQCPRAHSPHQSLRYLQGRCLMRTRLQNMDKFFYVCLLVRNRL